MARFLLAGWDWCGVYLTFTQRFRIVPIPLVFAVVHTWGMRKLALTGVALLLALVGCSSSSPVASVTPTDDTGRYLVLARVAFGLPATESGADADLLATGKSTCAGFSKGMDWDAVNEIAVMDGGRTADQAKLLIAAAVKGLCPQYSDRLPS